MKRNFKLYRIIFFSIILLYFIYKAIFGLFLKTPDTEIVKFGELSTQKEYECLIVRDEEIVKSPDEGVIKYYVQEGEKVEKNYKICEIYTSSVNDKDKKKLSDLSSRINDIDASKGDFFETDIEKIDNEIDIIVDEIRIARVKGDFSRINDLKNNLNNKVEKKRRISGDKSFSGANLERLEGERKELESKIKSSIIEMKSSQSGVVSYYIDGYEEILTPHNILNIKYEYIKNIENASDKLKYDKVIYDQPVFKLTDNTAWYIMIMTDPKDSDSFKLGKNVSIDISDTRIKGEIIDKAYDEGKSFIIIKTNQYASDFNKIRKINLNIIKNQYEGLKIHRDSIIEKDGELGVYVLDINRKACFKAIKVLGYNDEYAIIQNNVFDIKDGDSVKRVYTVKLYDEILRYGKKYNEGDIIY
ncbi:HlyD family efflux transporter periplasmic adaptor subunit [Maledivibacter halophilus]|uniref:Putative membrane fusion protein n=1 Tax=Maledivibacter halophilus TaxID=36842 RepID=A0A1T5MGE8_9FIRM|nr:HlyD family efflux transporter periplasmic adaptor subunit [Maledivibacter halophilus]SKC87326.1 putative membrane fusion protein [Maledivibacter halophilus]